MLEHNRKVSWNFVTLKLQLYKKNIQFGNNKVEILQVKARFWESKAVKCETMKKKKNLDGINW